MKLQLGDLTFDTGTRQLLRASTEVHLSPKAFDLLTMLVDQRPRALSKRELHERLWPKTFVSDANLASLVAEIRDALGDTARQPRFIRTAHRFGYAFCGEVLEHEDDPGTASLSGEREAARFCWLIQEGRRLPLRAGENILGRGADDGVRIQSPTVSRRHARIVVSDGGATIEDLTSKNGTQVRGTPVSAAVALSDGDEIRIGSVVLRFRIASGSKTATWTEPDVEA